MCVYVIANETHRLDEQTTSVCLGNERSPRNPIVEYRYHELRYLLQLTLTPYSIENVLCLFFVPMDPCWNR